ncbi:MAG: EthD domain-containing protein [Cardiobacterium sp.]
MFKIIMLVKKKAGMSDAEFRSRWHAHSEKVLALQETLHIRGYAKTLPPADQPATMRDTLPFAWDALGELWYDSREAFSQARATAAGQAALATLRADEATFVDLAQSVLWFGEEERVI